MSFGLSEIPVPFSNKIDRPVLPRDADEVYARNVTDYKNIEPDSTKLALADGLELEDTQIEQNRSGLERVKTIQKDRAHLQNEVDSRRAELASLDKEIKSLRLKLSASTQDDEIQVAHRNLLAQKAAERAQKTLELPEYEKRLMETQHVFEAQVGRGPIVFDSVGRNFAQPAVSRERVDAVTQSPDSVSSSIPSSVSSELSDSEQMAYSLAEQRAQYLKLDSEISAIRKERDKLKEEFALVDAEEVAGDQPKRWHQIKTELAQKEADLQRKMAEKKILGEDIVHSVRTNTAN